MNLERARSIADAVMMEGYALYPYRASSAKNRFRWTFGVIAPRSWSVAGGCEPWWLEAQVVVTGAPRRIAAHVRGFQIERRGDAPGWDEGMPRTITAEVEVRPDGEPAAYEQHFELDGLATTDRTRLPVTGRIVIRREAITAAPERALHRLVIRVENLTPWPTPDAPRDAALAGALASTHIVIGVDGGEIISTMDPPAWAYAAVATCRNTGVYPVLIGDPASRELALAAPFILYDYPQIAPESAGDLCDATEIDEILLLRTRLMTDDEKREARATDPRAAAIIDRADALPTEWLERLHGATRDILASGEMTPTAALAAPHRIGVPPTGSKVRLRTPTRRTDVQDLLYAGRIATIVDIKDDVDGTTFLGVTVDDDPAAELHEWYGRCHYYRLDEVDLL